jgi:type IV fimbrial biogenesis protein FimT
MLKTLRCERGVTLIELLIGLTILSILILQGLPSFAAWIQNTQIRTAAESVQNGLQMARTEAVRRNTNVQFVMGDASDWTVSLVSDPANPIQSRPAEGSANTVIALSPAGVTKVTFGGLGRIVANDDGSPAITEIKADSATTANSRTLCVTLNVAGTVRMCDPLRAAGDPQACLAPIPAGCL